MLVEVSDPNSSRRHFKEGSDHLDAVSAEANDSVVAEAFQPAVWLVFQPTTADMNLCARSERDA